MNLTTILKKFDKDFYAGLTQREISEVKNFIRNAILELIGSAPTNKWIEKSESVIIKGYNLHCEEVEKWKKDAKK